MALEGTLRVTPEELVQKAESVSDCAASMQRHLEAIREAVLHSDGYWKGEAGDMHRRTYMEKEPVLEAILSRLKEHSADLGIMGQNYARTEAGEAEAAQELLSNVIL